MPERVGPALRELDGVERRIPLARPPRVEPDVAALRGREEDRRVDARWERLDGVEGPCRQRHAPARSLRLRVRGEHAVGEAALHDDGAALAVDIAALERHPLVRSKLRLGCEDDERPEGGPELEAGTSN